MLGLELALLWACYGWHPFVISTWAVVDDAIYVQHAVGFLKWLRGASESWLGGFDCFLLSKAPLYGLWMAFLHLLGLPLRVGDFLLFVAGALLFRRAVRPVRALGPWEMAVVLFLLLANPFVPQDFALRRLTFHLALTNLCIIAAIGLALRAGDRLRGQLAWSALLGLCFGLCYLNREEAVWLSAAVATTFAIVWTRALLGWRERRGAGRRVLGLQAAVAVAFFATALPPILTVCTLNQRHYGVFFTSFRRSDALTGLVQRLTSLEPGGHEPYVPIVRATREKAYTLSPGFARLRKSLEGKSKLWSAGNPSHAAFNDRKPEDRELFVSYFEFALLWAAKEAGAKRAYQIEAMFRQIDAELGRAVAEGKITAGKSGPAILAARLPGDYGRMAAAFHTALSSLLLVGNPGYHWPDPGAPAATRAQLEEAGHLTSSWVGVEPLPNLRHALREPIVRRTKQLQTLLFPLLFLAMPALVVWRRREALRAQPSPAGMLLWTFAVPAVALAAFCASMAVVEVLGFKFLATMGYAVLGYSPLTVLCALAFVGLRTFLGGAKPTPIG